MSLSEVRDKKSTTGRTHPVQLVNRGLSILAPGLAAVAAEQLFITVFRHRPPQREAEWAKSATELSIPSPYGDLAAWVWGNGPRTVLLVHGWAGRGLQMGAFVQPLVEAGYRVVAYDAPSHGASPGRQANLFKIAQGLMSVAAAVGPLEGVIAHSLGTAAVLLAASRHGFDPGRFVAVSPMGDTRTMSRHFAEMTGFSHEVVDRMRVRFEARFDFKWDEIEPVRLASSFEADALVIHDLDDDELPADEAEVLAGRMMSAETLLTEGLGHRRILRDSTVVAAAADFIVCADASSVPRQMADTDAASAA